MNGKGSTRRPEDRKAIEANWERVFGKENPYLPPEYKRTPERLTQERRRPTH